ncbi:hypothetical protein HGA34_01950 [Candidatus Falkowbacteria bacterium]|nr:hypothetical protein [Candidatus Falkowbacteria bacterium]
MSKQNHETAEKMVEQKAGRRQKKGRPKMRVAGTSVKELQKLIIKRSKIRV